MKIVNVIQRYPPAIGGSETWCREVCQYLAAQGHQVRVLTIDVNQEEEYWKDPLEQGSRTVAFGRLDFDNRVSVRRYRNSLPVYAVYHEMLRKVLDEQLDFYFYGPHSIEMYGHLWHELQTADAVLLHTIPQPHNYVAFFIARLLDKKTIVLPYFHPRHPAYERPSNYWLIGACDAVIALTEFEKAYLADKGVSREKIHVVGSGIHLDDYRPQNLEAYRQRLQDTYGVSSDDTVITFIGRKIPEKGVEDLIEAVRALLSERAVKLFLVGPAFRWFRSFYAALSSEERRHIIDLGTVSHEEKVNLLHSSHLLALPSKHESFGIVFLEAWSCGIPVLGTNEGCVPSVIGDGGFVCEHGDAEDIADKIRAAIRDPQALRTIAERGHERLLANFTWDIVGRKTEEVIRQTCGGAGGRGEKALGCRKVAIVCNAYPPMAIGGAEIAVHQEAKLLQEQGLQVAIFAGELDNHRDRYCLREDVYEGIPVHRVCLHSRDYSADFFNFYHGDVHQHFEAFLDTFAPDVVHFHNLTGLSASLIRAVKRRGVRAVMTLHDHWGFCLKNTLLKQGTDICQDFTRCADCLPLITDEEWANVPVGMRRSYLSYQLAAVDSFISPSRYLADAYSHAGIAREKIQVIDNPLKLEDFRQVSRTRDKRIRFSFVGYLGDHKGVHTVVQALSLLNGQGPELHLNIVGSGEKRGVLEQQVADLAAGHSVRFWGRVNHAQMHEVYRETDVLILPSIWPENQPLSIMEAMASRIPVIGSRIGGIPELVADGETGYLFAPGDAADLAQKIGYFLQEPDQVERLGNAAHERLLRRQNGELIARIMALFDASTEGDVAVEPDRPVIAVVGKTVSDICAQAMTILEQRQPGGIHFLMADWLDAQELARCEMLWVVDADSLPADLYLGLHYHLPLVVPAQNEDLARLCMEAQCGLYYGDALQAAECLQYLLENPLLARELGHNGFEQLYRAPLAQEEVVR